MNPGGDAAEEVVRLYKAESTTRDSMNQTWVNRPNPPSDY